MKSAHINTAKNLCKSANERFTKYCNDIVNAAFAKREYSRYVIWHILEADDLPEMQAIVEMEMAKGR